MKGAAANYDSVRVRPAPRVRWSKKMESVRVRDSIDRGRSVCGPVGGFHCSRNESWTPISTAAVRRPTRERVQKTNDGAAAGDCSFTVHACSESKVEMAFPQVELRLELLAFTK